MTIIMPDEHPGRCRNHRMEWNGGTHPVSLRCLDYEGTEHVCRFPSLPPALPLSDTSYSAPRKPTPWRAPSEKETREASDRNYEEWRDDRAAALARFDALRESRDTEER